MAAYETEEQRIEAIKNWWKHNGAFVIAGAALSIAALGGWRGWSWYQEKQAVTASDLYAEVQTAINTDDTAGLQTQVESLRTKYASTVYAALATLHEAKVQSEKNDLAMAADRLRWVIDHGKRAGLKDVARIRLARVLVADNKLKEAMTVVGHDFPKAYASLVNEIRGDIFVAEGEVKKARQAYDQAIASVDTGSVEFLQIKRNDLGD